MKWIRYFFSLLWRGWFFLVFLIVFFSFTPILFFFTAIIKNPIVVFKLNCYWSRLMLWFSGIFYTVDYDEPLEKNVQYIFCPNHTSTLDIPLIAASIPFPILYMGKVELTKIPIFGYFFKKNSVIVDRKNRKGSYQAFLNIGEKIDEGNNVCIFPEGGIPKSNVFLKKFKNGPFRLAIEKNVMLVPVTLPDNKRRFPQEYYKGSPGFVRVKVHKPIKINGKGENCVENLNSNVYSIIFEQLNYYEKGR